MQRPIPDLGAWPQLEWEQWKDTAETLHMYMQVVGKTRLGLTPIQNHWWNIAFYLTARGLTTSAMPGDQGIALDIEFDLLSHEVVCRTSRGDIRKIALRPMPVADEDARNLVETCDSRRSRDRLRQMLLLWRVADEETIPD